MIRFLLGVVFGILLIAASAYSYFAFGYAPVATAAAPIPFETSLAKMALRRVVSKQMPQAIPIAASEENFLAGAKVYRSYCVVCHGAATVTQTAIAKGEFPKPPELFKGKGVTDDPAAETWWKVANGIRLTGMPAFKGSLSDEQMWQVSLLLANADKLSDSVRVALAVPMPQ